MKLFYIKIVYILIIATVTILGILFNYSTDRRESFDKKCSQVYGVTILVGNELKCIDKQFHVFYSIK